MKRLTIQFPPDRRYDFYVRAFEFGESLHSPIVHDGLGTLSDVDRMRDVCWVDVKDNHNMGRVKEIVRKTLA